MKTSRILIVDDDETVRRAYGALLSDQGLQVDEASSLSELLTAMRRGTYDVILLDLSLGSQSGLEGLPLVLREQPFAGVFILTASNSVDQAVECMRRGATGYLTKDLPYERLQSEILRFLESRRPASLEGGERRPSLLGGSAAMQELRNRIERIRDIDSTVLILGESGTGKEVIARHLHAVSFRRDEPFAAINCGAIPEALLESELFGHKKGAFTDARSDRKGLFEVAGQGTVLLDEIGDMPLLLQTKILRVLQERQFTPVGSQSPIPLRARVLCATHRDLTREVNEGRFRQDLFFRINVLILHAPPLRERPDDIPVLVSHFLEQCNRRFGRSVEPPDDELLERIMEYRWPGNVRELQNALERAVALSPDNAIHAEDIFYQVMPAARTATGLPTPGKSAAAGEPLSAGHIDFNLPLDEARAAFERHYLEFHLQKAEGNISEVARAIGRYRADVYRMIEKSGLDVGRFRGRNEAHKEESHE